MLTLAIETSVNPGSVALGDGESVRREIEFSGRERHSESLFPALRELDLPRHKLGRVVVGLGPGSFSGIRVGLAAAHAIALAQEVPVYGICSAFSVARQRRQVTRLGVFADARRGEFYGTIFQSGELERATFILSPAELEIEIGKVTLAVSAEPLPHVPERALPRAADLIALPEDLPEWVTGSELEPIYLREAVAP